MSNKRGGIFDQGRKETGFDDRNDEPPDPPKQATAAQLAGRKIKSAKGSRRPPGVTSGLSQSVNFGGQAQQPSFAFGGATSDSSANPFGFLSQSTSTPSADGFSFGGDSASNIFKPVSQPSTAPSTQSVGSFNFGGTSDSAPNPFSMPSQAPAIQSTGGFNFGSTNDKASNPFNMSSQPSTTQSTQSSAGFNFGGPTSFASPQPAPSTTFKFGGDSGSTAFSMPSQPAVPQQSTSVFNFSGSNTPASQPSSQIFGGFNTTTPAPKPSSQSFGSINFGGTSDSASNPTPAPQTSSQSFGGINFGGTSDSTPNPTPAPKAPAQSFGGFSTTSASQPTSQSFTGFKFGGTSESTSNPFNVSSQPPTTQSTQSTSGFNFGGNTMPAGSDSTPKLFGFASQKPAENTGGLNTDGSIKSVSQPTTSSFGGIFSTPKNDSKAPGPTTQDQGTAIESADSLMMSPPNPFGGSSSGASIANAIAQDSQIGAETPFNIPEQPKPAPSEEPSPTLAGSQSTASNMPPTLAESPMPSLTGVSSQTPDQAADVSPVPKIPKAHVPQQWSRPSAAGIAQPPNLSDADRKLVQLAAELSTLNQRFKEKINSTSTMADWSALSRWHCKQSIEITKNIANIKKERAKLNGITGHESTLSTKRKVNEESGREDHSTTPSKKARGGDSSQTANLFGNIMSKPSGSSFGVSTTKDSQVGQAAENSTMGQLPNGGFSFEAPAGSSAPGNVLSPTKSNTLQPSSTFPAFGMTPGNIQSPSTAAPFGNSTAKDAGSQSIFKATSFGSSTTKENASQSPGKAPAFGSSTTKEENTQQGFKIPSFGTSTTKENASQSPFKVSGFGSSSTKEGGSQSGFKVPSFGGSSSGSSGGSFLSQFTKKAKTAEELKAERKKKAKEADYDSDDSETEEAWSARWDAEEAAREEEEAKKKLQGTPIFSISGQSSSGGATPATKSPFTFSKPAGESAPTSNSPFTLSKPASGASTSLFSSRAGSPAPSVFNTSSAAPSPGANIFGHLSSGASSNNQDESDEDEQQEDNQTEEQGSDAGTSVTSSKRKLAESEYDSEEYLEDSMKRSKQDISTPKGSLMSRITRDPPSDTKKGDTGDEDGSTTPKANGTSTTPKGAFAFFDFNAASKTAPPKSNTFAGDNTYKDGSPIKFGVPSSDNKENTDKPLFSFQPATPTPAATGSKPAPFSFLSNSAGPASKPAFSFLAPNAGQTGPGSVTSSVFSSRAATPLSDAGASDKDSAAENDEEEGNKAAQLDLSELTEDEQKDFDVLFHTAQAIAKHQVDDGTGKKDWKNVARGPLWILKNKETGKALVRMRLPSGKTPVNYNILPKLASSIAGPSKKMVLATRPGTDGGKLSSVYYVVKTPEVAEEFNSVYNSNLPSA